VTHAEIPESYWTPSSDWCPCPERWHATEDPDDTEREVTDLVLAFVRALQPELVVETGTANGQTAEVIGRALQGNCHGHLWTMEIDTRAAVAASARLKGLPVTVVIGDSLSWEPPGLIDFAWIDSGNAQHRTSEIFQWRDKFRRGAVIGVHDTAPSHGREPLRVALDVLFQQLGWQSLTLRTPRGVTFAQVI
jgi:predicted O-methyltransferase YrrM